MLAGEWPLWLFSPFLFPRVGSTLYVPTFLGSPYFSLTRQNILFSDGVLIPAKFLVFPFQQEALTSWGGKCGQKEHIKSHPLFKQRLLTLPPVAEGDAKEVNPLLQIPGFSRIMSKYPKEASKLGMAHVLIIICNMQDIITLLEHGMLLEEDGRGLDISKRDLQSLQGILSKMSVASMLGLANISRFRQGKEQRLLGYSTSLAGSCHAGGAGA